MILVTERCNSGCRICGYGRGSSARLRTSSDGEDGAARPRQELSAEQLVELVGDAHGLGCRNIILSGGEPLLRGDIYEVFEEVCRRGIEASCAICTNGSLLDERAAQRLARAKPAGQVVISIDGHSAELHDAIRGAAGSFEQATRAIAQLNAAFGDRQHVSVNTIVNRKNLQHLGEITRLVASLGAYGHKLAPVYGPSADDELALGPQQLRRLYRASPELAQLARSLGLVQMNLSPLALVETAACHLPSFVTFVDSGGRVFGCNAAKGGFQSSAARPLGRFRSAGDLGEIWTSEAYRVFRERAFSKTHPCCARACVDVTAHAMNFLHGPCASCLGSLSSAA